MFPKIPLALSYDDVLLVPQYSEVNSRMEVDLSTKLSPQLTLKIPLISTKMDTITGVEMATTLGRLGGMGILPRFDTPEIQADKVYEVAQAGVVTAAAVGIKNGYLERAEMLINAGATVIDIDVAHGHLKKTIEATAAVKNRFGDRVTVLSGITSTYECACDLYEAGADSILVGVGAGSICTTRIVTGFGVPSITALMDTSRAARKYKKTFMPDAGIRNSGDIVKALATGASAIVGGNIFAGTDESPGENIEVNGVKYKRYNGSASRMEKLKQINKDPSDKNSHYAIQVEGVEGMVECKGSVELVVSNLLAGIRSGLSYAGSRNIPELWKKAHFIQVTSNGVRENNAHDILLVK